MPFGQIVIGPPGSGKTVYCNGMSQFLASIGRKVAVVNLDPANETIPYTATIDVRDLIDFEKLMIDEELGPNGALLYSMEYLEKNLDWLKEELAKIPDHYIIFDCPGQIELYTHDKTVSRIFDEITNWSYRLTVIQVFDSFYCKNPSNYISVLLVSLSSMLRIALPHVNVFSKIDLIEKNGELDFQLEYYTDVLDLGFLHTFLDADKRHPQFGKLNKALTSLIEDFNLVAFHPLNILDKESVYDLVKAIDKSNGFVYNSLNTNNAAIMELHEREMKWEFDKKQEIQERYFTTKFDDHDDNDNNNDQFMKDS
ncbi:GPN-loop GTPase 2 [Cavenderia fasciculata]|uniref:GPN-loop GTPase 2 n=1 Tax=Cavenderia fasciculata TaxID=261658 RepID=F4Q5Q1_CACFS|nr:GPN-loop GTPase 2 [Cavenderia fasciculata]EGG17310.1 GPN-loop GTPase 2 [Cavenderia fasciculata]|eukprot:XP_004355794.1 GPN-loop GTPase 2 [Cavenderia fasciculata]